MANLRIAVVNSVQILQQPFNKDYRRSIELHICKHA